MKHKYIGFDIDSQKTVACVVEQGQKDRYRKLKTDLEEMKQYLREQRDKHCQVHLTFEISGQAGYFHDALRDCVDTLTVSNPHKMTWIYRTRKKNDRIDARKQAVLLSIAEVPKVHMPQPRVRQWRGTILQRRTIVNRIVSVKNRTRALLKAHGLTQAKHKGGWWNRANVAWLHQEAQGWDQACETELWRVHLGTLLDELALLGRQLKSVTRYLDRYLATQPGGALLMSIPGVGPRTAEAILVYTDDVHRFSSTKRYAAYFGLTPKLDESGQCRRLGHISKEGPSVVRWLLIESTWRTIQYCPSLKAFYERVQSGQKQRRKTAVVATARKLLTIMRAMLLTGELFNESYLCQTPDLVQV